MKISKRLYLGYNTRVIVMENKIEYFKYLDFPVKTRVKRKILIQDKYYC